MCESGIFVGGFLEVCKTQKQIWENHLFTGGYLQSHHIIFFLWTETSQQPGLLRRLWRMALPATWRGGARVWRGKRRGDWGGLKGVLTLEGERRQADQRRTAKAAGPTHKGGALRRTPLRREVAENVRLEIPELLAASPCSENWRARRIGEGNTGGGAWLGDGRRRKGGAARVRVGPRGGGGGLSRAGRTCWHAGHA
jgi:hypothetical protein